MRMGAWHGADHLMVIRHMGQSHIDGLMEGTPQGIGGVPITRKQIRAQRKAIDLIEDEVGRPINYHSYISGVAGPDVAVLLRRRRRKRSSPGSAVQCTLQRHQLRKIFRRRLRIQEDHGVGGHSSDRRSSQRQRYRQRSMEGNA